MISRIIKATIIAVTTAVVTFLLYLVYLAFFAPKLKVVRIREGLGNQLYMYALAYALQEEIKITEPNAKVVLDLRHVKEKDKRGWVRNYFEDYKFNKYFNEYKVDPITRFARKLVSKRITDGYDGYNSIGIRNNAVFTTKGNVDISVYGQSALYFDKYRKDILKMFQYVKEGLDEKDLKVIKQMQSHKNSVVINVRLGDYLDNKYKNNLYLCSPSYYNKAIKEFEKLPDVHFFVSSNDIESAKKLLHFTKPHTFMNPSSQAHLDLVLSASAKHNLMPNSTFAWWAAYMNDNKNKIIVAPKFWARNRKGELVDTKERQIFPKDFNVIYIDNSK